MGQYLVEVLDSPWDGALDTVLATHSFMDSRVINSATLTYDGTTVPPGALTVPPGASITAELNVTTSGSNSNDDWRSTSWRFGNSGGYTCEDHSNHFGDGTYTESFTITAPMTPGTYNVYFRVHEYDGCWADWGWSYNSTTLTNVIVVEETSIGWPDDADWDTLAECNCDPSGDENPDELYCSNRQPERGVHCGAVDQLATHCWAGYCSWIPNLGSVVPSLSQAEAVKP